MDAVVSPVLHVKFAPLVPEAVRTELPQLFTTVTEGGVDATVTVAATG
jgi:hypothetical protein